MSENKTKPTEVKVEDFLATVSEKRQAESEVLIDLMQKISGFGPVMWGPSIIGFGKQHYKSEAGREGDMGILGFSPRKASLTVYFYEGFDRYGEELAKLGKHKTSMGCLYINKLEDVDIKVLEKMLKSSFQLATNKTTEATTVEDYVENVPEPARAKFDELRSLVKELLPGVNEVVSYGVVGYKPDVKKRAVVFISGWKDHLAVYPIPKDDELQKELKPYIKGKGTLWFSLDEPLPKELVERVVKSLAGK
jgi:uncharacterized protein YdhG (YjbR/CyaY superfamily)